MMEEQRKEQPIVEVSILADKQDYKRYYWYWIFRERPWYPALSLLYCIILFLYAAWKVLTLGADGWYYALIPLLVFPIFAVLLMTKPGRHYRRHRDSFDTGAIYSFFEDHFSVRISEKDSQTYIDAGYERYLWVAETASAFYLKKANRDYVYFPKKCFAEEQTAALRELFARKFGEKFKQQNNT